MPFHSVLTHNPLDVLQLSELRKTLVGRPLPIIATVMVGISRRRVFIYMAVIRKKKDLRVISMKWILTNVAIWLLHLIVFDLILRALASCNLPSRILLSLPPSVPSWPRNRDIPCLDLSLVRNSLLSRNTSSTRSLTGLVDCLKAFLQDMLGKIYSAFFPQ